MAGGVSSRNFLPPARAGGRPPPASTGRRGPVLAVLTRDGRVEDAVVCGRRRRALGLNGPVDGGLILGPAVLLNKRGWLPASAKFCFAFGFTSPGYKLVGTVIGRAESGIVGILLSSVSSWLELPRTVLVVRVILPVSLA